jgi:hypothetical protein
MQPQLPPYQPRALDAFVALAGADTWAARLDEIGRRAATGPRAGQTIRQRHALELAIERLRGPLTRPPSRAELYAALLASDAVVLASTLRSRGRDRLIAKLRTALSGAGTLVPMFHMLRTAALQSGRGFSVVFAGLEDAAPYDLLIARGALEAEIACEVVSAEEGRLVQRDVWSHLADRADADLRAWLAAHPGRYLLKMTLPQGLEYAGLAAMGDRIRHLLNSRGRRYDDAVAILRLEPLALAGGDRDLMRSLRREFGPEAHLAVTITSAGAFVMAARAGRADEIAAAVRRHLFAITPSRLSGARPGILSIFIDDTNRSEWQGMRDRLELEGEARQFLAYKAAEPVIAVTCTSRFELFGMADAVADGELRFRNAAHPAAKATALRPAILSSV